MKIMIFGANGMLGNDLVHSFKDYDAYAFGKKDIDITNKELVAEKIATIKPEFVINAAAYTHVDKAESDKESVLAVNAEGVKNIASACRKNNSILIHFSTDYVFDGSKNGYKENDKQNPINVYGYSKYAGEKYLKQIGSRYYLIRTSWLYGLRGRNFVYAILDLARNQEEIEVVNDQFGSPTYSKDLSEAVKYIIERKPEFGIYHRTNDGICTWFDFARKIIEIKNLKTRIKPMTSAKLDRTAKRPRCSVLINTKLPKLRSWEIALKDFITNELK